MNGGAAADATIVDPKNEFSNPLFGAVVPTSGVNDEDEQAARKKLHGGVRAYSKPQSEYFLLVLMVIYRVFVGYIFHCALTWDCGLCLQSIYCFLQLFKNFLFNYL